MPDSLFTAFEKERCPDWLCPACLNPSLAIVSGSFSQGNSAWTSRYYNEIDPEQHETVFSCMLRCSRTGCGETVAVCGDGEVFQHQEDPENGGGLSYVQVFHARSFRPALPLFIPPAACPPAVLDQLREISALLTGHPAAAANAIRSLAELLLDDLGIPREEKRPGKSPRNLSLGGRLKLFKANLGEHHEGFDALKLFGNAGSHGGTPIERKHLDDACLILEQLIDMLYHRRPDLTQPIARLKETFQHNPGSQ